MEERFEIRALDKQVLAVAKSNYNNGILFDWAVYIGAVPGISHRKEYMEVSKEGSKASIELAKLLFPYHDITKYRE